MTSINWTEEVDKRKEQLIRDTQEFLKIKSVLDEENATADAPLGKGVKEALDYMLQIGKKDGFTAKNVGDLAGHLEFGKGDEIVGILCHVDVVPEGDGWTSPPYSAEIRDGKIFARGAIDDKGPTMAAYYAMKIVKELELPLQRRVRMIIGTDEESNWRCVEHYFKHEEMPSMGFAPDADFPIIYAEKGIADFDLVSAKREDDREEGHDVEVLNFSSGRRYNMVPDFATVSLDVFKAQNEILQRYEEYKKQHGLGGECHVDSGMLILEFEGISAHGMEPDNGKNAGLHMSRFLAGLNIDSSANQFFEFTCEYFKDSRGRKLGVAFSDDITGDLTINVGILSYTKQAGGRLGLNMRYPVTTDFEKVKAAIEKVAEVEGFTVENFSNSKPHHVDENEFLVQTLKKVYEEQTGEKAELISIGGGTYARSLTSGVAFGPLFPGREDVAHQKDEYILIEDMLKATAIYAQAIYELAGK
ncbi:dipeptidase PepV [Mesobacillus foraminis]|uniref:Succinyl-diaminopimelate desuccinylase n=1 Tax=Mesobacillus foraminis TaxID=279826 RepID=A0A4V2RDC7_9BACI|nr:dipeptidase PepV [Mesobacillus foraminis]TCN24380.1 succinyl-diaminopimelate desuccinylase [Mesobacillus foraminis]